MALLDALFGSQAVGGIFSDNIRLQRMLDFEAALAKAEARAGIIPSDAAELIAETCKVDLLDLPELARSTTLSANPAIPLVKQLTALVSSKDPKAAGFVHWGATSQDLNDTGLILQIRDAWDILESDLAALCSSLIALAQKHRSTVMLGRTLMQYAPPTTFGTKVAGWLDAMNRHRARFGETRDRLFVLQFGGAVGTLAALGDKGLWVAKTLAEEIDLRLPEIPWHTQRDRIVEVSTVLGLCTGTLGKIARDISLHMQPEIAEIFEPLGEGRGSSSAMPHKRNPVSSARVLAAAIRVPALVSTMLSAMVQEDERGLGNWHAEWETVPEIFRLAGGALHEMKELIPKLEVDTARMRHNIDQTNGIVFAEAVSMTLARFIGKSAAHTTLEAATQRVRETGNHLRDELAVDMAITKCFTPEELDLLFKPENYLGAAEIFVDRVIGNSSRA